MRKRNKLQYVLEIVDWEHRYKFDKLQSGGWVINRISDLMEGKLSEVIKAWKDDPDWVPPRFLKNEGEK